MMSGDALADLLRPLRQRPERAGVMSDFDGTVSEIVDDPDDARPLDGVFEALDALAARYARVAVISGRPVSFLQRVLPESLVLSGLYGLEVLDRGHVVDHPSADAWREVVEKVASAAENDGPDGVRVERKGVSLTLHFRKQPELEFPVRAWA